MDLHIIFRGLCLFAPAKDAKSVDVLFPESTGHAPHHVHHPRIQYRGLLTPHKPLKSALQFRGLDAGSGTLSSGIPHVLRAGEIADKEVSAAKLSDYPGPTVATRISLPVPDDFVPGRLVWFTRGENRNRECLELTSQIMFVYKGVNAGKLMPQTKRLGSPAVTKNLKEPQATSGSRIVVVVSHLPAPEHDPVICPGDEVTHTHLYYDFLGASNDPIILDERPPLSGCGPWEPHCGEPHPDPVAEFSWFEKMQEKWSGTAFNCMLAQASPT